jgi:hypothetical protein
MNITEAIRILNEAKDQGTQRIIFAFWESDMFDRPDDDAWAEDAEHAEDNMDWSYTYDKISAQLRISEAIREWGQKSPEHAEQAANSRNILRDTPHPSVLSVSSVVNHQQQPT